MTVSIFKKTTLAVALSFAAASSLGDVIGFEDFDGGAINLSSTTNVANYDTAAPGPGGNARDVFGVVQSFISGGVGMPVEVADDSISDVSSVGIFVDDSIAIASENTTAFFAMNDMDGAGITPISTSATWTFDISAATSIDSIEIDLAAMGDFEAVSTDGFVIEAQIDGAGFVEIFRAATNEDISHTYRAFDDGDTFNLNDPLELFIDGSASVAAILDKADPTTGNFDTYSSLALAGQSGASLDVRVSWSGTPSGSEPMGIDNITINGAVETVAVPVPFWALLALMGGLLVVGRRALVRK